MSGEHKPGALASVDSTLMTPGDERPDEPPDGAADGVTGRPAAGPPAGPPGLTSADEAATLRTLERSAGDLMTTAQRRLEERFGWYRELPAQERSWVGLIAAAGISEFLRWCREPGRAGRLMADVFGSAPRELTRTITLSQTVDLVRSVVETVEEEVDRLAPPDQQAVWSLAVLRYSREVAFAAAQVYANAAEQRGAWDARLESLVVDAIVRGESDDETVSRATALGWGTLGPVTVVVGHAGRTRSDDAVTALRHVAGRHGVETLIAVQGGRLVVVLGGGDDHARVVSQLTPHFGPGAVVLGPSVPRLFAAGRSARAAMSGLRAAPAWPAAPRPVAADDLLPERALLADTPARHLLVERIHRPLEAAGSSLLETATTFLHVGRSIEASARDLFVHPNTVRYRLRRIAEVTGYDLTDPREAHVVRTAIAVAALDAPRSRTRRPRPADVDGPPDP